MFKDSNIENIDIEFISKENDEYDVGVYKKICDIWNDFEPEHITNDFVLLHNITTEALNKLSRPKFGKIAGLTIIVPFYIIQYKSYLLNSSILNKYIDRMIEVFIKYNKNDMFL